MGIKLSNEWHSIGYWWNSQHAKFRHVQYIYTLAQ